MKIQLSTQDRKLANYLCEYPMLHSVPFYFGNPSNPNSKVNNGTASLLKHGSKLFAVSNHHVLAEFLERQCAEEDVRLSVGGLNVEAISDRLIFDDADMDVSVFDFSDYSEADFDMFGNVRTQFHALGDSHPVNVPEKVVAFGGYPGAFRVRVGVNELNFHTFSSGASVVEDFTDGKIIVNIDHRGSVITSLSPTAPPEEVGGLSGGPVFAIGTEGLVTTFRFAGIIVECSDNFGVMIATPVELFAEAFG